MTTNTATLGAKPKSEGPLIGPFGRKAIRVGRFLNIDIGFDISWLFILALVTLALAGNFGAQHPEWGSIEKWSAAAIGSFLFFLCIVLHELGHSITSNSLGLPVRSITLFIFGGLARLDGKPKRPRDEFLIGIAGPIVSLALGGIFLGLATAVEPIPQVGALLSPVFAWLGFANFILAAFNLFPGHPLDGGHLLRAVVWSITGNEHRGTAVASALGTLFASFLMGIGAFNIIFLGSVGGFWLVLIGWFLMRASQGAVLQELLEERLVRVTALSAMDTDCPRVSGSHTVEQLIRGAILQQGQRHFCVEHNGQLAGLVTLSDVKAVPEGERSSTQVASIMVPMSSLVCLDGHETLWDALQRMDDFNLNQLPVLERGQLIGILTRQRLLSVIRNQMDYGRSQSMPAEA